MRKLENLMRLYKLVDGGRVVTPRMGGPTWRNSQGVSRRLDFILFSGSLGLLSGKVAPAFFSDHDGVTFCVRAGEPVFGPGYWRLNSSVLEQDEFVASFVVFFRGLVGIRSLCPGVIEWWEVAKERIREFTVRYCRRKAREARREVSRLQRLLELEYAVGNESGTVDQQACDSLKAELREVYECRARGYLMRTRHDFLEKDETCSAAFFSSVRAARVKHVLTGIRDEQGRVVTGVDEMVRVASHHYRSFFVEREIDVGGGEVVGYPNPAGAARHSASYGGPAHSRGTRECPPKNGKAEGAWHRWAAGRVLPQVLGNPRSGGPRGVIRSTPHRGFGRVFG